MTKIAKKAGRKAQRNTFMRVDGSELERVIADTDALIAMYRPLTQPPKVTARRIVLAAALAAADSGVGQHEFDMACQLDYRTVVDERKKQREREKKQRATDRVIARATARVVKPKIGRQKGR